MSENANQLRTVEGRVVSNKMNKSVTILVERQVKHPLYGKYIRRSTKLHAHDEENTCNEGDVVRVSDLRTSPDGDFTGRADLAVQRSNNQKSHRDPLLLISPSRGRHAHA